ncbi:carboxypeptidase-like regulatory domain-containing protein [Flavobacterium jejuense]|uniref:Carboxypeptidase-like regulatory domain-containing protein n=1 Tax=Flavobacterium jejuense TaxID=1544455 RepID=A0ABX0IXG4_9FLAO|nr:carboxypeptidase-like regulatory domain-containing protein [Flavobacterium jejuense]NHN26445.1 carboxypeptidase-like regulatory domain-containing protein [Flavobacterium jejuense]
MTRLLYSQGIEREILNGRIIADSVEVENITIFNISTNIGAVSDSNGKFSIKARVADTLYFQGLSFVSKKYALTEKDFFVKELEIRLKVNINELNEVVITPFTLTGNLIEDTKKIKTYELSPVNIDEVKYYDDKRFSSDNKVTTNTDHFASNGSSFNFKLIGKQIGKWLGIKGDSKKNAREVMEERRLRDIQSKSYAEHIKERFSHHFFVDILKIENKDITAFLAYSEMPSYELVRFLKPENELQLIEYLVEKAKTFKMKNKEESIPLLNEK